MTPLTRLLTFTLMFLLALLVAASASRWHIGRSAERAPRVVGKSAEAPAAHALLDRGTLALSGSAFVVAVLLLFVLGSRLKHRGEATRVPFSSRERERRSLTLLATTSAKAQEELGKERGQRESAQADSQHRLQLLNRALEEKIRIGRDLHDGVIQSLYATGLTLESAKLQIGKKPQEAEAQLAQSIKLINQSITDIRGYVTGLTPRAVRRDSLTSGLAQAVDELRAGRPLDVDWKIDNACVAELSDTQLTETMQITREAVSNALRHGGARHITVSLLRGDHGSVLTLRDDGRGFSLERATSRGQGLGNMKARAEQALGEFTLTSAPAEGTCIQVFWRTATAP